MRVYKLMKNGKEWKRMEKNAAGRNKMENSSVSYIPQITLFLALKALKFLRKSNFFKKSFTHINFHINSEKYF